MCAFYLFITSSSCDVQICLGTTFIDLLVILHTFSKIFIFKEWPKVCAELLALLKGLVKNKLSLDKHIFVIIVSIMIMFFYNWLSSLVKETFSSYDYCRAYFLVAGWMYVTV